MRTWLAGGLFLLLLFSPVVAAEALEARFVISSALETRGTNNITLDPIAVAVNTTGLAMLSLESSEIELCNYEQVFPEVVVGTGFQGPYIRSAMACYSLTDVRMILSEGQHQGWVALHAAHGATLQGRVIRAEARDTSVVTNEGHTTTRTEDAPDWPYFVRYVTFPHLRAEMAACGSYQGGGAFKVKGPDVMVLAKENSTRHETGESISSDAAVRERTMRWLYIRFDDGLLEWCGAAGVDLAAREARGAVNGLLSFRPLEGAATSPVGTYLASGKTEWIDGYFRMHLAPSKNERASLVLEGTMATTSMAYVPHSPLPQGSAGLPAWVGFALFGLALAFVTSSGFGYTMWRKSVREDVKAKLHAEAYGDMAFMCLETGDMEGALELARHGRTLTPKSHRLVGYEAYCLAAQGDVEGALKAYAEAHQLAHHGQYALLAARLLQATGASADVIEEHLYEVLQRSPEDLRDIEEEFPEIVSRPTWASVVRNARLMSR